jgi:hypothetical protein
MAKFFGISKISYMLEIWGGGQTQRYVSVSRDAEGHRSPLSVSFALRFSVF